MYNNRAKERAILSIIQENCLRIAIFLSVPSVALTMNNRNKVFECTVAVVIMVTVVIALSFAIWSVYHVSEREEGISVPGAGNMKLSNCANRLCISILLWHS